MVTAQAGTLQDSHTKTANAWDLQIADRGLIFPPFDARISTLVKKEADQELTDLLTSPKFKLESRAPKTLDEARGACHSYLSGNADWWRWKVEENVKKSKEFRCLNVSNFQTKDARSLRDKSFSQRSIGFLHQAIRYRGKANYRDALFLGYGKFTETALAGYVDDLSKVLDAFVTCAGIFCSRRLGKVVWDEFMDNIEQNRSFSVSPHKLWG